jgi:alkylation response protein AidB-like acyl-CoA dehydrogenase
MSPTPGSASSSLLNFSLTPEQERLIGLSDELSRERFAPRAAKSDHDALFPDDDYRDLAEHGLTLMTIPAEYGGLGLDPMIYALILKNIARGNGSTALTLNMHSTIAVFLTRLASEAQKQRYFGEAVREGKLFASTSSEPNMSFRGPVLMEATAEPVEGGYRVDALKHFCSLSTAASYYFTWATPPGESFADAMLFLAIPADSAGVELIPTWDTMAMRATASHSLRFRGVFVPDEHVVGGPGDLLRANLIDRFTLGYCAVYLGVAEAAYEFAHEYAASRSFAPDPNPISHYTSVQMRMAEMSVMLEAGNLLLRRAGRAVGLGTDRERTLALNQTKYYIGEMALQVTDLALKVVGGRGIMRRFDLERFIRDARAAPIMPPAGDRCLETVGKVLFGLSASTLDTGA